MISQASFGYVVALEAYDRPPRWRDEDDAEEWLDSVGVPDGYAMRIEPGFSFLMYAPRNVFEGLRDALVKYAESRPAVAGRFDGLIESLGEDAEGMQPPNSASRFSGIHPWSFTDRVVWDLWRLPASEVDRVATELSRDPSLSDHFVGRWDTLHPLGGDVTTARMLMDALELDRPSGDLGRLKTSLSRWLERFNAHGREV